MKRDRKQSIDTPNDPEASRWIIYKVIKEVIRESGKRWVKLILRNKGTFVISEKSIIKAIPNQFGYGEYICLSYKVRPNDIREQDPLQILHYIREASIHFQYITHIEGFIIPKKKKSARQYADAILEQQRPGLTAAYREAKKRWQEKSVSIPTEGQSESTKKSGRPLKAETEMALSLYNAGKTLEEAATIAEKRSRKYDDWLTPSGKPIKKKTEKKIQRDISSIVRNVTRKLKK